MIDETTAAAGVQAARRRLGSLIHEPALRDLSHVDRTFLAAMAIDDGPSKMADVASRLDRRRELRLSVPAAAHRGRHDYPAGHGHVDFTLPYLRDYLREHAATTGL